MRAEFLMIPAGSGARWYERDERRPKVLAGIGGGDDAIMAPFAIH